MNNLSRLVVVAAAFVGCACSSFASDNLVTNGDFESCGNIQTPDWKKDYRENCGSTWLIGWTCSQAGICFPGGTYLKTSLGTGNWAFLKKQSSFSQDISLANAGTYRLEFDYCLRDNARTKASTFVTFGEMAITNILGDAGTDTCTKAVHMSFDFDVAEPGQYALKFAQKVGDDASPAFDNISLVLLAKGINVASSPENVGEPEPAFGLHEYSPGTSVACSSSTEVIGETVKYHLAGWTMEDDGVVTTGGPTGIVWTVGESVANLTWQWRAEYKLTVTTSGTGTVEGQAGWYDDGDEVTLTAGDGFVVWQGDVDEEQALNRTLTVTMDRARSLTAVFGDPVVDVGYSHLYEYLESDGTQVIDLGVKMQTKTYVELYFQKSASGSAMQKFFGAYTTTGGAGAAVGCSTALALSSTFNTSWLPSIAVGGEQSVRMHVQDAYQSNGGYQNTLPQPKNGAVTGEGGGRFVNKIIAQDLNYYAFGVNVDGAVGAKGAVRIRRILIMSDDGATLHDFRAAQKSGVYGLVDRVTGVFRTNIADGANDFVVGPETSTAADALEIASDPAGMPLGFEPALGVRSGLSVGDEVAVSAPALLDKARLKATCTGWTLLSWNAASRGWVEDKARENHSGSGTSFTYVHTGVASKLVWHYTLSDPDADPSVTTRYVFGSIGDDANDGSTWTKAFRRIQAAINASGSGDTVLVGPGVYVDPRGFILTNGVKVVSACGHGATIIDGDNFRQGANIAKGAELDGFTIRNGSGPGSTHGGGASVAGTIRRCFITSNKSGTNSYGGGLELSGDGLATQCIVCSNYNNATWGGVAVHMVGSSILEHSLIFDNVHEGGGPGGIYVQSGRPTIRNCTIYGNCATTGGGIRLDTADAKVHDCIVWGNRTTSDTSAGAPNWYGSGKVTNVFSSVAWGVTVGDTPLVGNPDFKDAANCDFRLKTTSLCCDAAWGGASVTEDVLGNPRVRGVKMDIGAIESDPNEKSISMVTTVDGTLDKAVVSFEARGKGFDIAEATCYWTFDGRTPTASDHDAVGVTTSHTYGLGTVSAALTVVIGGETLTDTQANISFVYPKNLYVRETNPNAAAPYATWATAATSIQAAIDAAGDGSTVHVTNGTYNITSPVNVGKQLTVSSVEGYEKTVVNAGGKCRCLVVGILGAVVEGLTLTKGDAKSQTYGGGAQVSAGTLRKCFVTDNVANGRGGGLNISSDGLVSQCVVCSNYVSSGWGGAGVNMTGGTIEHSLIFDNRYPSETSPGSSGAGGGIFFQSGSPKVRNCTVYGNWGTQGGGIYVNGATSASIIDSIVWGNHVSADSTAGAPNWNGTCKVTNVFSSVAWGVATGGKTMAGNPYFKDVSTWDFRLQMTSPCRDAAWGVATVDEDVYGNDRVRGTAMDLGAIENDPDERSVAITFTSSGSLDSSTVDFTANPSGFGADDATFYWTFDGRTPSAEDNDGTGVTIQHIYGCGTHSVALLAVVGGETLGDRQQDFLTVAPSQIYVVTENEHAQSPYDTWAKAATNINDAVAVAADVGSTIWVASGVHKIRSQINVNKQLKLLSVNGPRVTEIDAGSKCRVLNQTIGNSVVRGFALTGGFSSGDGGGVVVSGGLLTNCVIRGNRCDGNGVGGGLRIAGSGVVSGCVVSNNSIGVSWWGGGVTMDGGVLENSLVCDNRTGGNGLSGSGGGIDMYLGGTVRFCTVTDNHSANNAGIHQRRACAVHDSIVWGNVASENGREVGSSDGSFSAWTNVVTSAGTDPQTHEPIPVGVNATRYPSLAVDPLFRNAAKGDYRIGVRSSCRNSAWGQPTTSVDLGGKPRVIGRKADIGCYECDQAGGLLLIVR